MAAASSSSIDVRVAPEDKYRRHYVFKFNGALKVDVAAWPRAQQVALRRDETNKTVYDDANLKQEFGAGSEYGRANREVARRKKLGHRLKTYDIDQQPWTLHLKQAAADQLRRYRCPKEAGAAAHADYWIFRKLPDGTMEAVEIDEWYNAVPIARHRTLNIDEAEEQFQRRATLHNKFALRAQLVGDEAEPAAEVALAAADSGDKPAAKGSTSKVLKISDRDDYESGSGSDDETDKVADVDAAVSKAGGKAGAKGGAKRRKAVDLENDIDDVAAVESDDGDEEGEEQDYMSDSGSEGGGALDELENRLRAQGDLGADELAEADEEESEAEADDDEANKEEDEEEKKRSASEWQAKNELEQRRASDDSASDSDDPDKATVNSPLFLKKREAAPPDQPAASSASAAGAASSSSSSAGGKAAGGMPSIAAVVAVKRAASHKELAAAAAAQGQPKAKRAKEESQPRAAAAASTPRAPPEPGAEHDEYMRALLRRKPHSTKELLHKLKSRSKGKDKTELVTLLAEILKRLKPKQENAVAKGKATLLFSL